MKGKIKWFNKRKGYGFIEGEDGKDIFVHQSAIASGFLSDGDEIEYEIEKTEHGLSAKKRPKIISGVSCDCCKKGDIIQVEYVGKLEDGTVFDSSQQHNKPLEFCVGSGQIIKGFDNAVVGMQQGEEKEVTIPSQDAYGNHHAELVRGVTSQLFPDDREVKPGMVFLMTLDGEKKVPVRITHVTHEAVTVDLNRRLQEKH